jgi:hypothetical protein
MMTESFFERIIKNEEPKSMQISSNTEMNWIERVVRKLFCRLIILSKKCGRMRTE